MEIIKNKNMNLNFKDPDKFINYLIRDHTIGEVTNQVINSR